MLPALAPKDGQDDRTLEELYRATRSQWGRAISHAARIVEEGLKAGLNLRDGGELAQDLYSLYEYLAMRLTLANIRNDENILDECTRLVEPLRQAWRDIRDQVDA